MGIEYITLLIMVAAIVVGYFRKVNTGLVGILFAFLAGTYLVNMSAGDIVKGWPTSTIFTLIGMTFLFSIAKVNGALDGVALSISRLANGRTKLIPVLFFLTSAVLAAAGPGPVVMVAIIAPIAMAVGNEEDIPDILTASSVITGCLAGGLNSITASGIIASTLGAEQGVTNYMPVFISCMLISTIQFILFYVMFGGLKLKSKGPGEKKEKIVFDRNQQITLVVILITILGIMILGLNTGLAAFCGGAVLLLIGVADQKKSIAGISWSTILLVAGMAILVNVVKVAGGIDAMTNALATIMTEKTAGPILSIMAGLMSAVSSASGVVMPTLIPTISGLIEQLGGNVTSTELLAGIVVGAHVVTASPLSTLGAMCLACSNEKTDKEKMFTLLMCIGFGSILLAAALGYLGLFRI